MTDQTQNPAAEQAMEAVTTNLLGKLDAMTGKLLEYAQGTENLLVSEVPLYVQELFLWFGVYYAIELLIGLASLASLAVTYKVWRSVIDSTFESKEDAEGIKALTTIVSIIIITIQVAAGLSYLNLQWLQIWLAPRVWLVEYLRGVVS